MIHKPQELYLLPGILIKINPPRQSSANSPTYTDMGSADRGPRLSRAGHYRRIRTNNLRGAYKIVLLRLRLKHGLASDAAPMSDRSLRLRRPASGLSLRHRAPFPAAQLRHGEYFFGDRLRGLGHRLCRERSRFPDARRLRRRLPP